jgi:predicted transcriptional regulator
MDHVASKTQLSIRIPVAMVEGLDRVAAALDRDRTWVLLRACRQYLEAEGADVLNEANGLASLDRGEGQDFDDVMAAADGIVAAAKGGQPKQAG